MIVLRVQNENLLTLIGAVVGIRTISAGIAGTTFHERD